MHPEETDLERRVLAHEQILQALLAQIAESEPHFLDQMRERFAGARRGAHEQDYMETADYAEAFLHEVMRLVRVHKGPSGAAPASQHLSEGEPNAPRDPNPPALIRVVQEGGVWHVTRDRAFLGDYLSQRAAREAAQTVIREIERQGCRAQLIFDE